jgi:Sap, sulfolipid-1-addressing protein
MAPCRRCAIVVVNARLSSPETYISLCLFCLIATSSVLIIEAHAALQPERSRALLARIKAWMSTHTDQVIIVVSLLVGLWLIGKNSYLLAN